MAALDMGWAATQVIDDPGVASASGRAKRYSDAADALRDRTDLAGKALAALATAGLTAIGISKVTDIYPTPSGERPTVVVLLSGFALMVVAIVAFTVRMWKVSRPLVPVSDLSQIASPVIPEEDDRGGRVRQWIRAQIRRRYPEWRKPKPEINEREKLEMERVYKLVLRQAPFTEMAEDLAAYERLALIAELSVVNEPSEAAASRLRYRAARIRAEVDQAQQRAKLVVIRERSVEALTNGRAALWAVLFVVGLVLFGGAADRLDSKRTTDAQVLKACKAVWIQNVDPKELPEYCDPVTGVKR
jgi:hypothetical protein